MLAVLTIWRKTVQVNKNREDREKLSPVTLLWRNQGLQELYKLQEFEFWPRHGVKYVTQLYVEGGFKIFRDFREEFQIPKSSLFRYFQLRHACTKQFGKDLIKLEYNSIEKVARLRELCKPVSSFYVELMSQASSPLSKSLARWKVDIPQLEDKHEKELVHTWRHSVISARDQLIQAKWLHRTYLTPVRLHCMLMFVAIQVLIWTTPTFAILSLTANPIFTMESLNGTETEQAYTIPLDLVLQNSETDPVTDGGTQENSQSALPSTVTPVLSEATDGGESNNKLQELSTTNIDPKQPITLDVFNLANTNGPVPTIGSASKENGDNSTLIPLLEPNKAYPFDEQLESFLEIPMENGTEGKQCFCNIPGQKGDKGDTGNGGEPGKVGKRGPQGLEGAKGKKGLPGSKGETGTKGDKGDIGPKGDSGTNCAVCEKGERGEQGVPGKDGAVVVQGTKGEPGNKGIKGDEGPKGDPGENGSKGIGGVPGIPGEVGPKGAMGPRGPAGLNGDRGMLGPAGTPGYRGPAGIPGRKGDKGQKGAQSDHENVAFSVGVRGHRNVFLPGQPIRFDNVFINENKPYSVKSGVFVANIEGVYFFTYHISLTHSSLMIGLAHNGKIVIQTQVKQYERNVCQASGSVLLHLREDDEIWLQVLTSAQNELISDESDSLFTGFILYSLED
ncbi:inner ear-specific collagen-like [Bufo gargarizans]|uniref:inner ear-specific collagen-like n=1 Tax=Bufo gargarizans TaxID=30331 RepID=UPI001CF30FBA|nr:inner ear-specific collagen-like [Bufo gargarizans]